MLVYVGTYTTNSDSRGIYGLDFDPASGALAQRFTTEAADPSYLALAHDGSTLYAVNEQADGGVSAFRVDRTSGQLTFLNRVASHGADPAHLSVHPSGRWVLVANYTGGTIASIPIRADGSLGEAAHVVGHEGSGPHPQRQEGPHPHMIVTDPAGELVLVPDLGLDQVVAYRLDAGSGQLVREPEAGGKLPPGAGPRHMAFSGAHAYVLTELASTVVAHAYDAGRLQQTHSVSTVPEEFDGQTTTAAIVVNGRYLYASNRGHDSLAIFEIGMDGRLTPKGHVKTGGQNPRDFSVDPSGRWLLAANGADDTIVSFSIDERTGQLEPTGHVARVPRPVRLLFR